VGFIEPTDGQIVMPASSQGVVSSFADIKVVMQHANLFPWLTVRKNVEFGLRMRGDDKAHCEARVSELLELVGLPGTENKYPTHLSGGMQQRVAIDAQMRRRMQSEIVRIWQVTGKTIIFVTHDISESVLLADRIVVLTNSPGRVKDIVPIDIPHPRERDRAVYDRVFELEQML
jgi:NitT/TauT family transport system ATP-binding protein